MSTGLTDSSNDFEYGTEFAPAESLESRSLTRRRFAKLAAGAALVVGLTPLLEKNAFAEEVEDEELPDPADEDQPVEEAETPPEETDIEPIEEAGLEPEGTAFKRITGAAPAGSFRLRPICSASRVLDISGASTSDGASVLLYSKHGRLNQVFTFVDEGDGVVRILNMYSGKLLDVYGRQRVSGAKVIQWSQTGGANQKWIVETDGAGQYRFKSALSTEKLPLYLDITGARDANNTIVEIWQGNGRPSQTFVLEESSLPTPVTNRQTYTITPAAAPAKVLDLPSASKASGKALSIWEANYGENQKFRAEEQPDGSFSFKLLHSSMLLSASGGTIVQLAPIIESGDGTPGNPLQMAANQCWILARVPGGVSFCNKANGAFLTLAGTSLKTGSGLAPGSLTQVFRLSETSPLVVGSYYVFTTVAGMRLDLTSASTANGANIELWKPNETVAQVFTPAAAGGNRIYIKNPASNRFIDINKASTAERANVIQWDLNNGANQQWHLEPTEAGGYRFASALAPNSWLGADSDTSGANVFLTHNLKKALVFNYEITEMPALGIKPDSGHLVFAAIGDTLTLKAAPIPSFASLKNMTYTSSNTAVATVNANGVVKATGWGECTITLRSGGASASCPVSVAKKWVAVTFDDGPASYTGGLLNELKKRNATCTFFVVGANAASSSSQALLARMAAEGHEVGNHTWRHDGSAGVLLGALSQTDAVIRQATGRNAPLMRPPGGSINSTTYSCGKPIILWSLDPQDWKYRDSNYVFNNVTSNVSSGDIILLHDIHATTIAAAPRIIDNLKSRGFACVTVSHLMGSMSANKVYRSGSSNVRTSKGDHW
jgi:peptidoglycan/xylan/chitin deacetylase (PgdA/CDA1 family)